MALLTADSCERMMHDTHRGSPRRLVPRGTQNACLVHIYPSGARHGGDIPSPSGRSTWAVGKRPTSASPINGSSGPRWIEAVIDGYELADLQSTNGTFVNDHAVGNRVGDGDYIRVGNCIYRFLAGGNVEADYHEEIYRLTIMDALTETHNKRLAFPVSGIRAGPIGAAPSAAGGGDVRHRPLQGAEQPARPLAGTPRSGNWRRALRPTSAR